MGQLSESACRSLLDTGAVGDLLYHLIDRRGQVVDNQVNWRALSVVLPRLRKTSERVLVPSCPKNRWPEKQAARKTGGPEKVHAL